MHCAIAKSPEPQIRIAYRGEVFSAEFLDFRFSTVAGIDEGRIYIVLSEGPDKGNYIVKDPVRVLCGLPVAIGLVKITCLVLRIISGFS